MSRSSAGRKTNILRFGKRWNCGALPETEAASMAFVSVRLLRRKP